MSSTALVKAATTAVSNKLIQRAAAQAVKTAAPSIAKAAVAAATTKTVKTVANKIKVNQTNRSSRAFAPVSYTTNYSNSGKVVRIAQSEIVMTIDPDKPHWYSPIKDYTVMGLRLSPSNETTFPWLANVAGLFDKFRFRKLSFTFVTTKPTNTQGTVSMAVDFDAYDSTPKDVVEMSNLAKFTTNPVYVNKTVDIPLNHPGNRSWYYNFDGSTGDLKTYNLGTFYICLAGVTEKNSHGYLVVNYDVELCDKNPKLTKTKSTMGADGVITQTISDSSDVPTEPPTGDQPPTEVPTGDFYYSDGTNLSYNRSWVSHVNNSTLVTYSFDGLKAGQTLVGNVNLFSPVDSLETTPGDEPNSTSNCEVIECSVQGDTANANIAFVAKVASDGKATITFDVGWTRDPSMVSVFATNNYQIQY